MAAAAQPPPPLDILVRSPEGFSLWNGPPFTNGQPGVKLDLKIPCSTTKFSDDGSRLMVLKPDCVVAILDCRGYAEIRSFQVPNLTAAALSPRGRFLQTFQKSSTPQNKNVTLWSVDSGEGVYEHFQKSITRTNWPSVRFSSDEAVACKMATNEIQFFDGVDFSKGVTNRLRVPGVAAIELSKSPGSHVAASALIPRSNFGWFYQYQTAPQLKAPSSHYSNAVALKSIERNSFEQPADSVNLY